MSQYAFADQLFHERQIIWTKNNAVETGCFVNYYYFFFFLSIDRPHGDLWRYRSIIDDTHTHTHIWQHCAHSVHRRRYLNTGIVNVSSIIVFCVIVITMIYRPRLVAHNALLSGCSGFGEKKRKTKSRAYNRYYCFTARFINIIIVQAPSIVGNIRV